VSYGTLRHVNDDDGSIVGTQWQSRMNLPRNEGTTFRTAPNGARVEQRPGWIRSGRSHSEVTIPAAVVHQSALLKVGSPVGPSNGARLCRYS
jgi:hypothetical protein